MKKIECIAFISKHLPHLILFIGVTFCISWKQYPSMYTYKSEEEKQVLMQLIKPYEKLSIPDSSICFVYTLPEEIQMNLGVKELFVRFSKNELTTLSERDYFHQTFLWNLGIVEYLSGNQWKPLHKRLPYGTDLIMPIYIENSATRPVPSKEEQVNKFFLRLLPINIRTDSRGNATQIIKEITQKHN